MPRRNHDHEDSSSSDSHHGSGAGGRGHGRFKAYMNEVDHSVNIPEIGRYIGNGFKNNYDYKCELKDPLYAECEDGYARAGLGIRAHVQDGEVRARPNLLCAEVEAHARGDGGLVDVGANAAGKVYQGDARLGPVEVKSKALAGEVGGNYTMGPDIKGFDIGVRANAQLVEVSVGPVGATIGASADTGVVVRFDEDFAIGGKVLGTGVTIGRTTEFILFGSGFKITWW